MPKDIAREWFERVWNQKDPRAIHELLDPNAVAKSEGGTVTGPVQFDEAVYRPLVATFPDLQVRMDGIVGDGGEVVVRWTAVGTHGGQFLDIPASRRRVEFSGMTWMRIHDGRVMEGEDRYNLHALIGYLRSGQASATVVAR